VEVLEGRTVPTTLTVGPNVNTGPLLLNQNEPTIAINPTNTSNLVVFSNDEALGSGGLFSSYTLDGGTTWHPSTVFKSGSSNACCDSQAVFDKFGNLFDVYLTRSFNIAVATSTDGGKTFSVSVITTNGSDDQPSIAVGGSSTSGHGSVWVSYNNGSALVAQGADVSGLGAIGAFGSAKSIPGSATVFGDFGDIAVGPTGQVMVTYQNLTGSGGGAGPANLYVNLDSGGLTGSFGSQIKVTSTRVGGTRLVPPSSNSAGIDAEVNLAYDNSGGTHNGRVYMVYTDASSTTSNATQIYTRFSDNNGSTWSTRVRVNDVTTNTHQLPTITVDQSTGNVGVAWYDSRNAGSADKTAQLWATVSTTNGTSYLANVQVSTGTSNAADSEPPASGFRALGYGDYIKAVSFSNNVFYPVWSDNSNSTGDNPNGTLSKLDIYTAKITVSGSTPPPSSGRSAVQGDSGQDGSLVGQVDDAAALGTVLASDVSARPSLAGGIVTASSSAQVADSGSGGPAQVTFDPLHEGVVSVPGSDGAIHSTSTHDASADLSNLAGDALADLLPG
jgi:hypothetical protein